MGRSFSVSQGSIYDFMIIVCALMVLCSESLFLWQWVQGYFSFSFLSGSLSAIISSLNHLEVNCAAWWICISLFSSTCRYLTKTALFLKDTVFSSVCTSRILSINSLFLGYKETLKDGTWDRQSWRTRRDGEHQGNAALWINRLETQMNAKQFWLHAQGLTGSFWDGFLGLKITWDTFSQP